MFRNGPEMDGGDTAYLGPTTIIEMTIPRSQSSSAATLDDSGVLAGPISCPPIRGVVHTLDGRRNMRSFVFLSHGCTYFGWMWRDFFFFFGYVSVLPSPFFFFFFDAWDSVLYLCPLAAWHTW